MSDLSGILDHVSITSVWRALGGAEPRYGRAPAIWRDTRDPNVSLSDEKGGWYDFRDSEGGGFIALVQKVRGGSPREALEWLADFAGIPLKRENLSPAEKRERARQWRGAQDEARRLVWWKQDLLEVLREERKRRLHTYHVAEAFLRTHTLEQAEAVGDLRWEAAFDAAFVKWWKVEELDHRIDTLEHTPYVELLPVFRARQGAAA